MANKLFHKVVPAEPSQEKKVGFPRLSTIVKALVVFVLVVVLSIFVLQVVIESRKFYKHWNEIKFAYEHPEIVKSVRTDYETKQQELNQAFLRREKTSEEKLIDEVVSRLEKTNQLK